MQFSRPYLGLKWIAAVLLASHLVSRWIFPENNIFIDLVLFNLIGLFAAIIARNGVGSQMWISNIENLG